MKLKVYVVDLDLSPRQKKFIRGGVVVGAVIAALGIGIAIAAPPHVFATGETLQATDLNALQTQITALQAFQTQATSSGTYSLGGKFCGSTITGGVDNKGNFNGNLGGYSGSKSACQTACGGAASHMCTADELVRTRQLGGALTFVGLYGWYSSSAFSSLFNSVSTTTTYTDDCLGWTTALHQHEGPAWDQSVPSPNQDYCDSTYPILCCK